MVVLIVLGILVALGAPAMQRSAAKSGLRDAAGQLRVALAKARLEAIESGVVQTFRYQPDSGRYGVEAHPAPSADPDAPPPPEEDAVDEADVQELPGSVVFLDPDDDDALPVADENRDRSNSSERIHVVDADAIHVRLTERSRAEWSRPIVFFPTGRSSDARFRLLGERGYWIELELRGLTGTVSLGELQRPQTKEDLEKQREEKREEKPREEQRPETPPPVETPVPLPETPLPEMSAPPPEAPAPAQDTAEERQP